jgi:hypothetical protein
MSETDSNPRGVFEDLATNPATKAALLSDQGFAVDDFAHKHAETIRTHYAKGGYALSYEEAHQQAARLWRYLREPV